MRSNRPDASQGLSAEDCPEEFARRMMIRSLAEAVWVFGVDPDSIFVAKMRRALGMAPEQELGVPESPRRFHCAQCYQEFVARSGNQKFCSDRCIEEHRRQRAAKQPERARRTFCCEQCGRTTTATHGPSQKFCSADCRSEYERSKRKTPELFRCLWCKEEHYRVLSHQRYCSSFCNNKYHAHRRALRLSEPGTL
jgi:hypothetical protein